MAGLPSLRQSGSPVFIHHFYQSLPHPLSHLPKELPVVNGTDVNLLCDFLLKVLRIRQVGQMADQAIYEITYPYCRSELIALVTNAVTAMERIISSTNSKAQFSLFINNMFVTLLT